MKNFLFTWLVSGLLFSVSAVSVFVGCGCADNGVKVKAVHSEPRENTFAIIKNSYVQIEGENTVNGSTFSWTGCGTEGVYKGRVFVLTARHVAHEAHSLVLVHGSDDYTVKRDAVCVHQDESNDLALLWVSTPRDKRELPDLLTAGPCVGDKCWYVSSGSGVFNWLECGTVAKLHHKSGFIEKADVTLVTGMGWYGSSGGGVWVNDGNDYRLIGVVSHGAANSPRTPIGCPSGWEIMKFLKKAVP